MAIATTAQKNALATAYGAAATHAALFTADPGTSGAATGEVSGGTYARQALSWSAPSNGVITATATFNVPAGTTVTFAGVASASTGATIRDKGPVTSTSFPSAGTFTLSLTFTQT